MALAGLIWLTRRPVPGPSDLAAQGDGVAGRSDEPQDDGKHQEDPEHEPQALLQEPQQRVEDDAAETWPLKPSFTAEDTKVPVQGQADQEHDDPDRPPTAPASGSCDGAPRWPRRPRRAPRWPAAPALELLGEVEDPGGLVDLLVETIEMERPRSWPLNRTLTGSKKWMPLASSAVIVLGGDRGRY